jgi:hypothetical protein
MEAQVGWGTAMIFIALAAAHAIEAIVAGRRSSQIAGTGTTTRGSGRVAERVGLLLLLAALAAAGVLVDHVWIWLALGIVTANLVRHAAASIRVRTYTPGIATGALLAVYVVAFIAGPVSEAARAELSSWAAMVIGIAFVAIGHLSTQRRRPPAPQLPTRA